MKKWLSLLAAGSLMVPSYTVSAQPNDEQKVIVVFDEKIDKSAIAEAEGEINHLYKEIPVASITVPADEIQELKNDPSVERVEKDTVVRTSAQILDWGIEAVNTPAAWNSGYTGKGVKVAVVDTGIASHSDLNVAGGTSFVDYTASYEDDNGHGTIVAGIIGAEDNDFGTKGVAPDADIYAVKSLGVKGSGYLSTIIAGIDWAITNKMDIVNLSLGTQTHSAALEDIMDEAYANGMLIVAAAGNDGTAAGTEDTVDYPARYNSAIAVAAVDSSLNRANFSSTGNAVEIAAPGVDILAPYLNDGYAKANGTSMAAPYVAGELALLMQANPQLTNQALRAKLIESSKDLGSVGRDTFYGFGLMQLPTLGMYAPLEITGVKELYDSGHYLEGTVSSKSEVMVTVDDTKTFVQDTDANGAFKIKIGNWAAGTSIKLKASAGSSQSSVVEKTVLPDETAPTVETAAVTEASTTVTGKINEEAKVQLQIGSTLYPETAVATDENGYFKLTAAKMQGGSTVKLIVKDNAKTPNVTNHDIVVADQTAPSIGKVNPVSNTSNFVEGTVNESAVIYVNVIDKKGNVLKKLGATESTNGVFKFPLSFKLSKGTILSLQAEDLFGNTGKIVKSTVIEDRTPPKLLTPAKITVDDSGPQIVTGQLSEAGRVEIKELGIQADTDVNGYFEINVPASKANAKLTFVFYDSGTAKSETAVTVTDITAPEIEVALQPVYETSKYVVGKVSEAAVVTAEIGGKAAGSIKTDAEGNFKLLVNRKAAGTVIVLKAKDAAKPKALESHPVSVTVIEDTVDPVLDPLTVKLNDASTMLEGKISEEAKISVAIGGKAVTKKPVATDANGNFKVTIGRQKAGTDVSVLIEDYAGSQITELLTVADQTAPVSIKLNPVYHTSTTVSGSFTEQASVSVFKVDAKLAIIGVALGTGLTDEKGQYTVSIGPQPAGTKLMIQATDNVNLVSQPVYIVIKKDNVAPSFAGVPQVNDTMTAIEGNITEQGTVQAKVNNIVVGEAMTASDGSFKVIMNQMYKAGTRITLVLKDSAGNQRTTAVAVAKSF
ncbi:S8 family serine peptidase [Domibacillus sp. A3M-37]|uniref:S8 family serine peptidase n=1 Tax=Domibacillus sp. A3M-37 TaxID=2962037 RepID=UPI0020B8D8B1|nr:S8 family serine peptidase [Domibacillus sp. A3M-37]MCP3761426.1 S8 family serine peptidase [Domibacillus sp. A3M-37]